MPKRISCLNGDVLSAKLDVLVLKYADGLHGADMAVARALSANIETRKGTSRFIHTNGKIAAREILVVGVGALGGFEYNEIERFARESVERIAAERPDAARVGITIHGPGYGLDELASMDSLIRGLRAANASTLSVEIVERDARRAKRCEEFLTALDGGKGSADRADFSPQSASSISRGGTYSKRLFASLPFKKEFLDHWEYAIQPAAHDAELVIERLDHEHFVGDIVAEIRGRIAKCAAVVALIDENNPNVFLEVGYAWGVGKPTILALKTGTEPAFDVRTQRIIRYERIGELKAMLHNELRGLAGEGVF